MRFTGLNRSIERSNVAKSQWVFTLNPTVPCFSDIMDSSQHRKLYDEGFNAALLGYQIDRCRYRLPEKRAAWLHGYREGEVKAQINQFNDQQKQDALTNIEKMKQCLKNDN